MLDGYTNILASIESSMYYKLYAEIQRMGKRMDEESAFVCLEENIKYWPEIANMYESYVNAHDCDVAFVASKIIDFFTSKYIISSYFDINLIKKAWFEKLTVNRPKVYNFVYLFKIIDIGVLKETNCRGIVSVRLNHADLTLTVETNGMNDGR